MLLSLESLPKTPAGFFCAGLTCTVFLQTKSFFLLSTEEPTQVARTKTVSWVLVRQNTGKPGLPSPIENLGQEGKRELLGTRGLGTCTSTSARSSNDTSPIGQKRHRDIVSKCLDPGQQAAALSK